MDVCMAEASFQVCHVLCGSMWHACCAAGCGMRMVRHCVACAYGFAVRGMCVVRQYVACKWLGCTSHVYCLTVRGMCVVWQ